MPRNMPAAGLLSHDETLSLMCLLVSLCVASPRDSQASSSSRMSGLGVRQPIRVISPDTWQIAQMRRSGPVPIDATDHSETPRFRLRPRVRHPDGLGHHMPPRMFEYRPSVCCRAFVRGAVCSQNEHNIMEHMMDPVGRRDSLQLVFSSCGRSATRRVRPRHPCCLGPGLRPAARVASYRRRRFR